LTLFKRKNQKSDEVCALQTDRGDGSFSMSLMRYRPIVGNEEILYRQLRESVPIIDAAIVKLVRLCGGFTVECFDSRAQSQLDSFLGSVRVGAFGNGMETFVSSYLEQLLTYGTAVGEILPVKSERSIGALYNVPLGRLEFEQEKNSPMSIRLCSTRGLERVPIKKPQFITVSTLNPEPGEFKGVSILRGLPFVSSILMGIYNSIGLNWERLGNLRYAVTYRPGNDSMDGAFAAERAKQIANEWTKAMENTKLTVTVNEMAKMLGVSRPVAYDLTKKPGFPAIRISDRRIVIPVEALNKWLNESAYHSRG